MRRLERITVRPEGRRARAGWYEVLAEGPALVLAVPLNSKGQDRSHYDAAGTLVEVQELISTDLIVRRQPARINPHYGTMEVTP